MFSSEKIKSYEKSINSKTAFTDVKGGVKGGMAGLSINLSGHFAYGFGTGFVGTFKEDQKCRKLIENQHIWDRS